MMKNIDFLIQLPSDIRDHLVGKKAIVTGGTGMIGREIVRLLIDHGCSVTSVSLDNLSLDSRAKYVKGDLSDLNFCLDICSGVDYVFHVAGIKGSVLVTKDKPASFFVPLLMMNTNMLEAARRNKVDKVLYTSSIGAYSPAEIFIESKDDSNIPPMDMFPGWAKRMAEMQIDAYRIQYGMSNFAIVRPSNIYGPGDNFDEQNAMVIPSLISRVHRGDSPVQIWGDGSSERDFLHATDAAIGIILACLRGTDGKPINLGCGYGVTIKKLVETLQEVTSFESFFDTSKPSGFPRRIMDMTYAEERIGFVPQISLKEGLGQVWSWFLNNQNEHLNKKNYFR
jgi:GDP-L-fucose synthase